MGSVLECPSEHTHTADELMLLMSEEHDEYVPSVDTAVRTIASMEGLLTPLEKELRRRHVGPVPRINRDQRAFGSISPPFRRRDESE